MPAGHFAWAIVPWLAVSVTVFVWAVGEAPPDIVGVGPSAGAEAMATEGEEDETKG